MTPPAPSVILHHGTTLARAQRILAGGPDPFYVEPGGTRPRTGEFSTTYADGRVAPLLGTAEQYARLKAANFPAEGGPAILEVEVPDGIVEIVRTDLVGGMLERSGEVRFEPGVGINELLAAWPNLPKRIVTV